MGYLCNNREIQEFIKNKTDWRSILNVKYINSSVGIGVISVKTLQPGEFLRFVTGEALGENGKKITRLQVKEFKFHLRRF